ncbi:nucleotide exchange factor GrpE [Patescibacteria group bacterium]|nr:nucleotide exchange factor GrpE [Patescibacteria group bacterium]
MKKKNEKKHEKNKEVEGSENKLEELENQLKRTLADYQNLEKRVVEDRAQWIKLANKQLLLKILPALDNLTRAQEHVNDTGLNMSVGQIFNALKEEGVERMETIGKEFDPNAMECIQVIDGEDGIVIEETRPGYKLYDKLIRPAQVKVGKKDL